MIISNNPNWEEIAVIVAIIFGVLGVIVGVISVIIAYSQLAKNRKGFSCEFLSIAPILKIASGFQEQIEIRLRRKVVRDVYLVIVRLFNSGGVSIKPEDYVKPIKLSFNNGQIISVDVIETDPDGLGEVVESQDKTSVTLKNILLNSKDKFVLKLLLTGFDGSADDINVDGRIVGVKKIRILRESTVQRESSVYVISEPVRGIAFVPVMFVLICVLITLFVLLYIFTYVPR
jgi:hypothetical protein